MSYPSDGVLPGFEWVDNPHVANYGYETNGPARIMLHMTVGMGLSAGYVSQHSVPPQLWANPYDNRRYQTGSLNNPGKALYQPQFGSADAWTNKHGYTIQVELVGIPVVNAVTYTDGQYRWIGENVVAPIVRWFQDMSIPFDRNLVRQVEDSSGSASEFWWGRMSERQSVETGGLVQHIVEWANDHWDCSVERLDSIMRYALAAVGGGPPPPPPPPPSGAPNGSDVAYMQQWLNDHNGAGLSVDGDYGPLTTQAVANWQARLNAERGEGLAVDGDWGPATTAATDRFLNSGPVPPPPGPPPPPPPPPSGNAPAWPGVYLSNPTSGGGTAQWQQQMANRGWSIDVDDEYGPASESVCTQFQTEKGLGVDGVVGPQTWEASWTAPVT